MQRLWYHPHIYFFNTNIKFCNLAELDSDMRAWFQTKDQDQRPTSIYFIISRFLGNFVTGHFAIEIFAWRNFC